MTAPSSESHRLPRVARALLRWSLPEHERRFVLDDLEHRYRQSYDAEGPRAARLWYWRQAWAAFLVRAAWPAPDLGITTGQLTLRDRVSNVATAVRIAVRSLARRPGLVSVAVLALALGVGATTTAFSIVWGTVLRGLPFEESDRLIHFERQNISAGRLSMAVTPHDFAEWRDGQNTFESLAAYVEAVAQVPQDAGPPARYSGVFITANAFELLRARPMMGRTFSSNEDTPGGPAVAVISHTFWEQHFGSEPDVIGSEVVLNGTPTTIIGVMPEDFGFPVAEHVWLPLRLDLARVIRGEGRLDVFGRLESDVTLEEARTQIHGISNRLALAHPEANTGVTPVLKTFQAEYVGEDFTRTVYTMLAGALIVLLVACANVANLLLARARSRGRELAVRAALGAGRTRLMGALFAEAAILTVVGSTLGVGLAHLGVSWFERAGTQAGVFPLPHGTAPLFWWDIRVDGMALLFVLGITVVTALAAGLLPGLHSASTNPGTVLRSAARGADGRRLNRFSRGLVVTEVAMTTGLMVVAGLLLRSVLAATAISDPVTTEGVTTARVALPFEALGVSEAGLSDHTSRLAFAEGLERALLDDPGLSGAAITTQLPTQRPRQTTFSLPDALYETENEQPATWVSTVSPGFFEVFDISAIEGRTLDSGDQAGGLQVALVNRSFADRFFPDQNALEQRIRLGPPDSEDPWVRIVGVVPDLWTNALEQEQQTVYVALSQSATVAPEVRLGRWGLRFLTVAVRSPVGATTAPETIRQAVFRTNPTVPVQRVASMDDVVSRSTGRYHIWARFYSAFAGVALFLAAIGLYGVMAFGVGARTGEIGVRRALGAPVGNVVGSVIGAGLRQILSGAAIGLLIAVWLSRGIEGMLFRVDASDPLVFAVVLGMITCVGVLASLIPAHRAASVEPTEALRTQ